MAWAPIFTHHPRDTYNEFRRLAAFLQLTGVSPLTTKGDLYTFGTGNDRLGVGSNGQVLTADSTQAKGVKWATPSASPLTTKGDLYTRSSVDARLAVGSNGQVLVADSGETTGLRWGAAGGSPRAATKVVAASNSVSTVDADYVCDGTADQTEINNAIVAAGAGGRVLLLEGDYSISGSIVLTEERQTLEGQGWGTVLTDTNQLTGGVVKIDSGSTYCRVENFAVNINAQASCGIRVVDTHAHVIGLRIYGLTAGGTDVMGVWTTEAKTLVQNCLFAGASNDIQRGVFVDAGDRTSIIGNYFDTFKKAVEIDPDNCLVLGNHFVSCTTTVDDGGAGTVISANV